MFIGYGVGSAQTSGHSNVLIGDGVATTGNGSNNTVIGSQAASVLNGGSSNTIIGSQIGISLYQGSNSILIGNGITTAAFNTSNYLDIGDLIIGDLSKGILVLRGPTTVVSACGTSPTLAAGSNDMSGQVTVGSTATSCTVTFANAQIKRRIA